jgi:cell division protein FtsI/penicillin-binding protein 2
MTITLCYLIILGRLFYWQIIKNPELYQKVINQNYKPETIIPYRGKIFDSENRPLVLNQTHYLLSMYKPDIKDNLSDIVSKIKNLQPSPEESDINQLDKFVNNQNIKWITLKYFITETQKLEFEKPGISFAPLNTRFYPEDKLAKNILGYVSVDSVGNLISNGGLESYYQKQLKGKNGFVWETKDATGDTVLSKSGWQTDAVNGRNLHLSINRQIQYFTESTLENGIDQFSADSGSITIIRPETGSIIAMASFTATSSATPSAAKNPIISDLFEPGSIFKPLVMAMALNTKTINLDYICTKCDRPHQIGQYSISNWDNSLNPNSTLRDIIKNSDNIGMSYVIANLGLNNFLKYFNLLGLNRKTGIDLQGEAKPITKSSWPEIDFATASFGQGFAITQLQMLTAFNTIANNGVMVSPHVVEYFDDSEVNYPNKTAKSTSVFDHETTQQIKQILKYAVENGVVAKFKPPTLEVCAKSGTAQIAIKGGYSESSTIASYVGFSPCNNPKFTMIVTINNPKSSPWGSSTAAPIWYELASKLSSLL